MRHLDESTSAHIYRYLRRGKSVLLIAMVILCSFAQSSLSFGKDDATVSANLAYRLAALKPDRQSPYDKESHQDFADQLYAIVKFSKTYKYIHHLVVEPAFRTIRNKPTRWDKDHLIEQAYLTSALSPHWQITAGKKTEYSGSGFTVNPSDLLHEAKDIFDPLNQREGERLVRLRYQSVHGSIGLGFLPNPGASAAEGRVWLQASGEPYSIDARLQITFQEADKFSVGLSAAKIVSQYVELHWDGRWQSRQRDPNTAQRDYLNYSSYRQTTASGYYLVGSRLIFTPRRSLIIEGIQQQNGLLPVEMEAFLGDLNDRKLAGQNVGDPPGRLIGRHYGFVRFQDDESWDSSQLGISWLRNFRDHSSFLSLSARYYISPLTSVELAPTVFIGGPRSEFGSQPFDHGSYLIFRATI